MKQFIKLILLILLFSVTDLFSQSDLPLPDHIVVVILENHAYEEIIGSAEAPYINSLAMDTNSALFTNSYAIEHPSQPNYLDLFSGCNQGITNNNVPATKPFTTPNLARQLIDSGKTFISYSEDLPSVGFDGASSGRYVRKHNPVANWMGTETNQVSPTLNQPFTAFPSENFTLLPTVALVIPNQDNNMHDGSIATADDWINNNLSNYIQWAKSNNSLFILTFDEDFYNYNNHIVTIFTGQMVEGGQYSETINHYSVLRTIEDIYRLPFACNASTASTITNCWNLVNGINIYKTNFSVYPNPVSNFVTIEISDINPDKLTLSVINVLGKKVKEVIIKSHTSKIPVNDLEPGLYVFQLKNKSGVLKNMKVIIH